jgi:DNA-binding transcriptional regulator GbsR (MarR family)
VTSVRVDAAGGGPQLTSEQMEARHRVTEQVADLLVVSGVGRMPARVYAALLLSETGSLTASDLAETLQISPAAVSGAVRYLVGVGMVARGRPRGARRDEYRLAAENWYELLLHREPLLRTWSDLTRNGAEAVGPDTSAGRRMAETAEFFEFMITELSAMLQRWKDRGSAPAGV